MSDLGSKYFEIRPPRIQLLQHCFEVFGLEGSLAPRQWWRKHARSGGAEVLSS